MVPVTPLRGATGEPHTVMNRQDDKNAKGKPPMDANGREWMVFFYREKREKRERSSKVREF